MHIKIFNQSQLSVLRNINPLLKDHKIPRMVLHEIGYILEFKKTNPNDYVVLFFNPLKNDLIEILDRLQLYLEEIEDIDDKFHTIKVKGKKHPMKKNRIWSWYDIFVPSEDRTIFVVYSMKRKDLNRKGGSRNMEVRRWRKRTRRTMSLIIDDVLEVIMMELETECLSPDVYRYSTEWGMNVVYYIFDFELMENLILEPIYLNKADIHFLGLTENELFQKVLKNTFIMSSPRIMPFPEYLRDLEGVSENALISIIRELTGMMEKIKEEKKQLWCVTNIIGMRGAVGGFYKRLLREFCMTYGCRYLLLGFCNNDYTFLSMMNENTVLAMAELIDGGGSIRSDKGRIIQKKLLVYDSWEDILGEFGERDLV